MSPPGEYEEASSHGAHEWKRHGGSIGTTTTPGRVLPGKKMPGQHGNKTVSVLSQRVAKIIPEKQLVLVGRISTVVLMLLAALLALQLQNALQL